jgi:hypothetical protein
MAQLMKDPVDGTTESQQAAQDDELKAVFDISNLKISDFKAVQLKDARTRHPFDGYPDKKVQIGTYMKGKKEESLIVNLTHLVIYKGEVKQDPSGERVSLGFPAMFNNEGKQIRPNTEKIGTVLTAHNRRAKDYESGGVDTDCVFDRVIKLADGELSQCCIIPSPSVRAQIVFRYNSKTERVEPDGGNTPRYLLADPEQISRLRRIFEMIINPRIRLEESIRKNFDESGDSYRSSTLAGIPEGE